MNLKQVIKYGNANALEATWVDGEDVVKCHAYSDRQMDELRADIGEEITPEIEAMIADVLANQVPIPAPTEEELISLYLTAIQSHLDTEARAKHYDNIVSACSYAGYENEFRAEGESFGVWRAKCWKYAYQELDRVKTGTRTIPTVEEFIAELPVRILP